MSSTPSSNLDIQLSDTEGLHQHIDTISITNNISFVLNNDLAKITIHYPENTILPKPVLDICLSNINPDFNNLNKNDYNIASLGLLSFINKSICNSISTDWNQFKNFTKGEANFQNIDISFSIDVIDDYKPYDTFHFAIDKYRSIHNNSEPNLIFSNQISIVNPLFQIIGKYNS